MEKRTHRVQYTKRKVLTNREVTHGSQRVKEKNRGLDSNIGNKFKLKQTIRQILTWKSNRDEKSIVQDLNEIFNRRRERAMHKIQLNKNTKHSREKKKQCSI